MGKANKVKVELRDAVEMVDLIQTLKDIADNKYFTLVNQRDTFKRFGESFTEFFRLLGLTEVTHPLLKNDNPSVGIIVVTVEGSFLGDFNSKIIRMAIEESKSYDNAKFIAVGGKSVDLLRQQDPDVKLFSRMEEHGMYETALAVKEYIVDEIMGGRLGRIIIYYAFSKSFETIKQKSLHLLPCVDLLEQQKEQVQIVEDVIIESNPNDILGYLANLWVITRMYEIFMETLIAAAAAQSQFLDDSVDKQKKEKKKTLMKFRKAKKSDIDKSLRETFSARMMTVDN
ncbi:MAG: F0F1 ATP synthase subunit gamma [Candidatus Omnitrophica bacterium]|nr:F0F1 ATP synthase subunit gamma [Candidatus Omnitrophota bacterium]